jgi:hypothetical protein
MHDQLITHLVNDRLLSPAVSYFKLKFHFINRQYAKHDHINWKVRMGGDCDKAHRNRNHGTCIGTAHRVARSAGSQPEMTFRPPKMMHERTHGMEQKTMLSYWRLQLQI